MSSVPFTTDYAEILAQVAAVDPSEYAKTRNHLDGAVTRLSPYISRGVISTRLVAETVLQKGYKAWQIQKFLQELGWRDYFQQVWRALGEEINEGIKRPQEKVAHDELPIAIDQHTTGVEALDQGIAELYETGYMHNHMRMYVAATTCNVGQSYWKIPARWLYYHLLDADWASNTLSWQWVAGAFAQKKYYANQGNINKFTPSEQQGTFLDMTYEKLMQVPIPSELQATHLPDLTTKLPTTPVPSLNPALPIRIYTFYNLDPAWRKDQEANKILLLEPSFFEKYPSSPQTLQFILDLGKNIPGLQVYVAEFQDLKNLAQASEFYFKEHPTNRHFEGKEDSRDWINPEVEGYFPSFFSYWKLAGKNLKSFEA